MTIRYLSDLHFDHETILAFDNRPFNSVAELGEALIARWNAVVEPEDLTWILGDFCPGDGARWRTLLQRLNGRKALICGNHDAPESVEAARDLLEDVAEYREIVDGGRHVSSATIPSPPSTTTTRAGFTSTATSTAPLSGTSPSTASVC